VITQIVANTFKYLKVPRETSEVG